MNRTVVHNAYSYMLNTQNTDDACYDSAVME